jgi:hypothetical protein
MSTSFVLAPVEVQSLAIVPRKQSLEERLEQIDLITATLDALAGEDLDEEIRESLDRQLRHEIHGTRAKIDATNAKLAQFESDQAGARLEMERLAARMKRRAGEQARLEAYVIYCFSTAGRDSFEGNSSTLTKRLNPPALKIDDPSQIPAEYMVMPEPEPPPPPPVAIPDTKRIKAALTRKLKEGEEPTKIPGARITQGIKLVRT